MKTSLITHLTAAASLALLATSGNAATTICNDTFDSGTGDWYKAYAGGTGNDATTLANVDGRLSFATTTPLGGYEVLGRSFSEQTLTVGDSITLAFEFRQTSATGILRFGLYDLSTGEFNTDGWANRSTGTFAGYTTFIRNNGSNIARLEEGPFSTNTNSGFPTYGVGDNGHVVTDITSSGGATNFTFQNNTDYQFTFSITRTSLTQTDTLLTVMEGATTRYSVGGSQTTGTHLNVFDTAILRVDTGTALFDNVQVTFVPEPSAALLGGVRLARPAAPPPLTLQIVPAFAM